MTKKILNALGEEIVHACKKCRNYGYYNVDTKQGDKSVFFFCDCPAGEELKKISIEWRLNDLRTVVDNIIPRLDIIKERLSEPDKAKEFINALKEDLQRLKEKAEQGLK